MLTPIGGDLSHTNMQLVERLLVLFSLKQQWMLAHHGIVSTAVYTFLRCVLDHGKFPDLQSQEVALCVKMLQEKVSVHSLSQSPKYSPLHHV